MFRDSIVGLYEGKFFNHAMDIFRNKINSSKRKVIFLCPVLFFNEISDLGTLSVFQKQNFDFNSYKSILEKSISPFTYSEINNGIDSQVLPSIILIFLGFTTVFLLEKTAAKKPKNGN